MKLDTIGLTFAAALLSSIYYGCTGVEQTHAIPKLLVPPQAQIRKHAVEVSAGVCTWAYTAGPDGKPEKGTLKVLPPANGCTATDSTTDEVYVSDTRNANSKKVFSAPAGLFITEGSCRYCYVNSSGGMSCVTVPSC